MSEKKKTISAVVFRWILIGVMVLLVAACGAGFYFGQKFLAVAALEADHAKTDAEVASSSLTRLQQLKKVLEDKAPSVKEARQIVGETERYRYQDQIIADLNKFANLCDIKITSFDFGSAKAVQSQSNPSVTIPGVVSKDVQISLDEPVSFDNYLRFLRIIEQNLTKMQVNGVSLTPDSKNPNQITNAGLGITIYVKS